MTIKVTIEDGNSGRLVEVTPSGELVVAPLSYDETEFKELALDDTAYNFYAPKAQKQFVITGFLAVGDQQITANANANVVIYEAGDTSTTTVDKILVQFVIKQDQSIPAIGLRILVRPGKFINAKTDDDDVHMTIMGHYIDQIEVAA